MKLSEEIFFSPFFFGFVLMGAGVFIWHITVDRLFRPFSFTEFKVDRWRICRQTGAFITRCGDGEPVTIITWNHQNPTVRRLIMFHTP